MPNTINTDLISLVVAAFIASAVEVVEALTIVLAMGLTRGWKSTIVGTIVAILTLVCITAVLGMTLKDYVSQSALQFVIGSLLLIFGLQWLRKAILRSSGLKAAHDEDRIFKEKQASAMKASSQRRLGLDWFAFVVSFKGVFLEGTEVVFIVLTFGLGAQARHVNNALVIASIGAALAAVLVLSVGAIARRPLSRVPENTMKFAVALLLSTFGTFWSVEGLGAFCQEPQSLSWPLGDWSLLIVLAAWAAVSAASVSMLRRLTCRIQVATALACAAKERGAS